jgi:hypothetical protein
MRSANFEFLIPVTLNETNLERMLIQILERMVKGGKTSPPHNGDKDTALRYQELLTELQNNPKLKGFGSDKGRSVLDGWLRTSIVEMIPVSKSKSGEQIDYLRLLSVASYRSGLPKWRSRNRKTDATIYASLCNALPSKPEVSAESLRRILEATDLTTGIEFPQLSYPWKDPEYSGQEKVDISALLEMRFLEGVNAKEPKLEPESGKDVAIPELFDPLGREMLEILLQFGNWSTGELTSSLTSIMALRLFQVPIRASSRIGRDLAGIQGGQEEDIEIYEAQNRTFWLAGRCNMTCSSLQHYFRNLFYCAKLTIASSEFLISMSLLRLYQEAKNISNSYN